MAPILVKRRPSSMKTSISWINTPNVKTEHEHKGKKMRFHLPNAPNQCGIWEGMVGCLKRVMYIILVSVATRISYLFYCILSCGACLKLTPAKTRKR